MTTPTRKVAVVTGSNKGIGLAVVRGLCKKFDGDVYLTARNEANGKSAVQLLMSEGLHPKFHQLDIIDTDSTDRLKSFLQENYGGLDVLVNNAAIAYKAADKTPFAEQTTVTFRTNFWCTLDACRRLFPILKPHARVVNVTSFTTDMVLKRCSKANQDKIKNKDITMPQLEALMKGFETAAQDGTTEKKGWPTWAYAMSKVGVRVMSSIQQRELKEDPREDIIVNSCDPGWVQTDMTGGKGSKTPDQGADTLLYCALLPPNTESPKGDYVSDRKIHRW